MLIVRLVVAASLAAFLAERTRLLDAALGGLAEVQRIRDGPDVFHRSLLRNAEKSASFKFREGPAEVITAKYPLLKKLLVYLANFPAGAAEINDYLLEGCSREAVEFYTPDLSKNFFQAYLALQYGLPQLLHALRAHRSKIDAGCYAPEG